jgi:hypothetical protein
VNVVVELCPGLERFAGPKSNEGRALQRHLLGYLNDTVADLAVPGKISLTVRRGNGESRFALYPYRVSVNGRECRLELTAVVPKDVESKELATSITRAVSYNRELIITAELSEKIREDWSSEVEGYLPGLSPEGFGDFLAMLVRRGFGIERGRGISRPYEDIGLGELTAAGCFERAVAALDATAIKVFRPKGAEVQSPADDMPIKDMFEIMRDGLFYELGILLPKVAVDTDESLEDNEFRLQINDVRFPPTPGLAPDQFLVNETIDGLAKLEVKSRKAIGPVNGIECALVEYRDGALDKCRQAGLTTRGPAGFIILSLAGEIRRNAGAFLTTGVAEYGMNQLRQDFPALVDAALKRFGKVTLTRILKNLLDEELSIRDLRGILEGLLSINGTTDVDLSEYIVIFPGPEALCPVTQGKGSGELDAANYSDCVRMSLKRYISHKYTRGSNILVVYLIDPEIEAIIRNVNEQPLTSEERERLIKAIFEEAHEALSLPQTRVLLTTFGVRRELRRLIAKEFPRLPVVCYQELSPEMNIQPIARVSW